MTKDVLSATRVSQLVGSKNTPTPEQAAMIEAPTAPVVVVAGAGSGKTETMAGRVVWNVANEVTQPERVLGLTFTRKATGELAARLRQRLTALSGAGATVTAGVNAAPTILTYHSYAQNLVAEHGMRLGIEPGAAVLTTAGMMSIAMDVVDHAPDSLAGLGLSRTQVASALLDLGSECAEHVVDPAKIAAHDAKVLAGWESLPATAKGAPFKPPGVTTDAGGFYANLRRRPIIVDLLGEFSRRKRELGVMDFGDLVALAVRLTDAYPDVVAAEREKYDLVLLDEFQDTSYAQLRLLRNLFGHGTSTTAVGDPHQSIYGWRGASASNLGAFASTFRSRNGDSTTTLHLSTSWRNEQTILRVANAIAAPLATSTNVDVAPLEPRPGAGAGRVDARWCETSAREVDVVCDWIIERWVPEDKTTAAILTRTRSAADAFAAALRSRGVAVDLVGGGGLLEHDDVADVVSVLRIISGVDASLALTRLVTSGRFSVPAPDLHALGQVAREQARQAAGGEGRGEVSLVRTLDSLEGHSENAQVRSAFTEQGWGRLVELARVLRGLRRSVGLPLVELVAAAVRQLGGDIEAMARACGDVFAATAPLTEFVGHAHMFSTSSPEPTLRGFVAWIGYALDHERGLDAPDNCELAASDGDATRVTICTVHASKGLEWDVVAVPGLRAGSFPTKPKQVGPGYRGIGALPPELRGDRDSVPQFGWGEVETCRDIKGAWDSYKERFAEHAETEERRLAYVAVTRARSALLLSGAAHARVPDPEKTPKPKDMSPFLEDAWNALAAQPVSEGHVYTLARFEGDDALCDTSGEVEQPLIMWPSHPPESGHERAADIVAAYAMTPGPRTHLYKDAPFAQEVARILKGVAARQSVEHVLPQHLSASHVGRMVSDPDAYARAMRRPIPSAPAVAAHRGTRFHEWIEAHYRGTPMLELPGFDEEADDAPREVEHMQQAFLASPWASRSPRALEVPIEFAAGGTIVRCRIDAVFDDVESSDDDAVVLVDWKSGRPPRGQAAERAQWQLIVYRQAWIARYATQPKRVRAAFFYASTGETVWLPADVPDAAQVISRWARSGVE